LQGKNWQALISLFFDDLVSCHFCWPKPFLTHPHFKFKIGPSMIEINFDNPLARQVRPCRRIVLEDGFDQGSIDPNWLRKIWIRRHGDGADYIILRNSRTQVPKGFTIEEEYKDGDVIPGEPERRILENKEGKMVVGLSVKVHVCNKNEGNGDKDGMWFKYEPLDGAEMEEV
jgi:hypothetical protein